MGACTYIADADSKQVFVREKDGKVGRLGSCANDASDPSDVSPGLDWVAAMAVNRKTGDVYLTDQHKADKLDSHGKLTTLAGARREEDQLETVADGLYLAKSEPWPDPPPAAAVVRFPYITGLAFDDRRQALYLVAYGNLLSVNEDGTITQTPSDIRFTEDVAHDHRNGKVLAGGNSQIVSGGARVKPDGPAAPPRPASAVGRPSPWPTTPTGSAGRCSPGRPTTATCSSAAWPAPA